MSPPPDPPEPPPYTRYRARPRLGLRRNDEDAGGLAALRERAPAPAAEPPPRRLTPGRVVRWVLTAAAIWVAVSLVLFVISAQLREGSAAAEEALDPGGYTLTSPNTVLVLGSDKRSKETSEPGSENQPSRADTILLLRAGGGRSARLSIPRDTVVDIPGRGRAKINAAYAYGGTRLMVRTVKEYLGMDVNHVLEVDFAGFPRFVDAMGGINYRGGCVVSRINGGFRNGGYTLRLRPGETHLDGRATLALARTRKNECNPRESDLSRARRQQKIMAAIKDRLFSPAVFARLPWVAWRAPQTVKTDMAGPSLLGLFGAMQIGGNAKTVVLRPSGAVTLPDGGAGLVVSEDTKRRAVRRFLRG